MVLGQGPSQDARSLPSRRRCDAGESGFSSISNHLGLPSLFVFGLDSSCLEIQSADLFSFRFAAHCSTFGRGVRFNLRRPSDY